MSLTPVDLLRKQTYTDDCLLGEEATPGDDEYLQGLLDAAEEWVCLHTHRPIEELCATPGELKAPVRHAVLMMAAHWYNQREAATPGQMNPAPYGVETLLTPYRRLSPNAP